MKKKWKSAFGLLFLGALVIGGFVSAPVSEVNAQELVLSSPEGDGFYLDQTSFNQAESVVYAGYLSFDSGQAGGLVFGAQENDHYFVLNVDRYENRVKLIYFVSEAGNLQATEMYTDWYIGNDKMTESESSLVKPKVASIDRVHLKVVLSVENDGVHGEFYVDNIRRFGVDNDILLTGREDAIAYEGGFLGINAFRSEVRLSEIAVGESDYSYYSELYRQQYHYSQFAHWNNDPNGLVYYDGYYHLYYQTNPFDSQWGDMYWGHARSRDLTFWELLPICLFPDTPEMGFGDGNGYMWSGSAMVYHRGMSETIDAGNWFSGESGLIAFYTRDGALQNQVLMSSDDGGMTWTKRILIPQNRVGINTRIDCRDPKVFPLVRENDRVATWGMTLSNQADGKVYFLKSEDLCAWDYAGEFAIDRPECVDVYALTADDASEHTVLTFSGRSYLVGELNYDAFSGRVEFIDLNGEALSANEKATPRTMDYGKDSYATQTFYIDDPTSEYDGQIVGMSWFSGVPGSGESVESGMFAQVRDPWNGGGMTIPVRYELKKDERGYALAQTPIVRDSASFAALKTNLVDHRGTYAVGSDNPLEAVDTHVLEISAKIRNPEGVSLAIRVNVGNGEYTEIGWNPTDGYYVDRSWTSDGGIAFGNYHRKYASGILGSSEEKTFYILSDNGSLEAYCEDFTIPFYVLTLASPYSVGAEFVAGGEVEIAELSVNRIDSIWRRGVSGEEGVLYLSDETIEMDLHLTKEKRIMAYFTGNGEPEWEVLEGKEILSAETSSEGITIWSLRAGEALIRCRVGKEQKDVRVIVHSGEIPGSLDFTDGTVSGTWLVSEEGLIGDRLAGDGFLLSKNHGDDFTYSARFDLGTGAACALVFRADEKMSDYLIANYDNNGKIVKLWSPRGEIANVYVGPQNSSDLFLSVKAEGKSVRVFLNGNQVIDAELGENEPLSGYFGLNVCATRAIFKEISVLDASIDYVSGDLLLHSDIEQHILSVSNVTLKNALIDKSFYRVEGKEIVLCEQYFSTLPSAGDYRLKVVGESGQFEIVVRVERLPDLRLEDIEIQKGTDLNLFVGNRFIASVKINGEEIDADRYAVNGYVLRIDGSLLTEEVNEVEIDAQTFTVTLRTLETDRLPDRVIFQPIEAWKIVLPCIAGGLLLIGGAMCIAFRIRRKKHGSND